MTRVPPYGEVDTVGTIKSKKNRVNQEMEGGNRMEEIKKTFA